MDASTALSNDIIDLLSELVGYQSGPSQPGDLHDSLSRLIGTAGQAAPSYQGLAVTVVVNEQPMTLTVLEPSPDATPPTTSMSLTLAWVPSLDSASRITFYAGAPGAFVDLAADLTFALGDVNLHLDDDIASAPVPGLTGLHELDAVNRALGILIGHGHTPDSAKRELRRRADTTLSSLHQAATVIAADPTSAVLDR